MVSLSDLFEQSISYEPGHVITREGDENRDLYVLSEGALEISVTGDDGEQVVVGEVHPPEIIGEISFLNGSPRTATITAKTHAEVYILSYYQVDREMSEIPAWFKLILRILTQRMQSCSTKIKELEEEVKRLKKG
ncbi:MAG: Crp/Fnr family transcriptional regulator [Desulfobulbaceae bacterium]|uniref:Crp/Fnr family transcriptional regulator n=1 Tax=Candidatus Desulfobia pelagia TaxID=2841692 RepID=A0A8J6NC05_9BACT|nr:Crp/Fnr family transcriptional regulator [Candidatus Desulfobia pelagia]